MQQPKMLTYRQQRQLANQSKRRDSYGWWALSRHPDHSTTIWNITRKEDGPHPTFSLHAETDDITHQELWKGLSLSQEFPKREMWHRQVLADVSEAEGMDWAFIVANTCA